MYMNTEYVKNEEQIVLEQLTRELNERKLTISFMQILSKRLKQYDALRDSFKEDFDYTWEEAHEISALLAKYNNAIVSCIVALINESSIHSLINGKAKTYGARYDQELRQYDTYFDVISLTYTGLYRQIGKGENKGRLRLDTYLDAPDYIYHRLRTYITNNICKDSIKMDQKRMQYEVPEIIEHEDGKETNHIDRLRKKNSGAIPEIYQMENTVLGLDEPYKAAIIYSMLDMYVHQRAERAYLLGLIILHSYNKELYNYDTKRIVDNLNHMDFNELFFMMLENLESESGVDLSAYKKIEPKTGVFYRNFFDASYEVQIERIYRLKDIVIKQIKELPSSQEAKAFYCWDVA